MNYTFFTYKPEISVKVGNIVGTSFKTTIGILQGDCLSAILFISYLAKCLQKTIKTKMKGFLIDPTYADDLTVASTNKRQTGELEQKMPQQLSKYNLTVNADKTEKYEIPRPPAPTPLPTTKEVLIQQKNKKILWSELDWLVNYIPPPIENKESDWRKCNRISTRKTS